MFNTPTIAQLRETGDEIKVLFYEHDREPVRGAERAQHFRDLLDDRWLYALRRLVEQIAVLTYHAPCGFSSGPGR